MKKLTGWVLAFAGLAILSVGTMGWRPPVSAATQANAHPAGLDPTHFLDGSLDDHAPLIGYAMDGFGLFAHDATSTTVQDDATATPPTDTLDACQGHFDPARGYHYHARPAGGNQVLPALRGTPGTTQTGE